LSVSCAFFSCAASLDVKTSFEGNVIKVFPKATVEPKEMTVESD
jgi:3-phosphoshikimate 1-carboxyvinyltransferase